MPKDLRIILENNLFDLKYNLKAGDLYTDEGLESAVIISLFTDKRANDDDILPDLDSTDKRGWWADQISDIEGDLIGSRRWIYAERAKTIQEVLDNVKKADEEALYWLIEDGIVSSVKITTERQGSVTNTILAELIEIKRKDGTEVAYNFYDNWQAQINDNN